MLSPSVLDTTIASLMLAKSPELARYEPLLSEVTFVLSFQTVAAMRYGALLANWGEELVQGNVPRRVSGGRLLRRACHSLGFHHA